MELAATLDLAPWLRLPETPWNQWSNPTEGYIEEWPLLNQCFCKQKALVWIIWISIFCRFFSLPTVCLEGKYIMLMDNRERKPRAGDFMFLQGQTSIDQNIFVKLGQFLKGALPLLSTVLPLWIIYFPKDGIRWHIMSSSLSDSQPHWL